MGTTINLQQLGVLQQFVTEFSNFSDDYIFIRITEKNRPEQKYAFRSSFSGDRNDGPIRIEGMAWVLCLDGQMDLEINLSPCTISANCLAVIEPGAIVEIKNLEWKGLDCCMLFVSSSFLRDVNFDLNALGAVPTMSDRHAGQRGIQLSDSETAILKDFLSLLSRNTTAGSNTVLTKSIARCLIAALNYQAIQFYATRASSAPEPAPNVRSRRSSYVKEFMKLVHAHHRTERSVAFYASKLFISPKYLSLLIKEHTGQSASEVIDSFVILEAKNLLRFSGKNIQQVSYELNFPNQSSFGKYFKHNTGMSPSEYQRS